MNGDELKKLGVDLANLVNDADKLIHGGGVMPALFGAIGPVQELAGLDYQAVKVEIQDDAKRKEAETALVAALNLTNKSLQAKVAGSPKLLEQCVQLAESCVADFNVGKSIVDQVKALFS